jgi:hypothetical protein
MILASVAETGVLIAKIEAKPAIIQKICDSEYRIGKRVIFLKFSYLFGYRLISSN